MGFKKYEDIRQEWLEEDKRLVIFPFIDYSLPFHLGIVRELVYFL